MRSFEVVLKFQDVETVMAQVLLRWLGFQLCVDHPYRYLLNFANALRCGALSADLPTVLQEPHKYNIVLPQPDPQLRCIINQGTCPCKACATAPTSASSAACHGC